MLRKLKGIAPPPAYETQLPSMRPAVRERSCPPTHLRFYVLYAGDKIIYPKMIVRHKRQRTRPAIPARPEHVLEFPLIGRAGVRNRAETAPWNGLSGR